jgi:carbon storage regulator
MRLCGSVLSETAHSRLGNDRTGYAITGQSRTPPIIRRLDDFFPTGQSFPRETSRPNRNFLSHDPGVNPQEKLDLGLLPFQLLLVIIADRWIVAVLDRFGTRSATEVESRPAETNHESQGGRNMLVLTRRMGEEIVIGDRIRLTVVRVEGGRVRLGVVAPVAVRVCREELSGGNEDEAVPLRSRNCKAPSKPQVRDNASC